MDEQTPELTTLSWYRPSLFVALVPLGDLFTFPSIFSA